MCIMLLVSITAAIVEVTNSRRIPILLYISPTKQASEAGVSRELLVVCFLQFTLSKTILAGKSAVYLHHRPYTHRRLSNSS